MLPLRHVLFVFLLRAPHPHAHPHPHPGWRSVSLGSRPLRAPPRLTPPLSPPPAAVQVAVGARGEARGSWTRFPVAVLAVFRSGEERARRGSSALWVPARDAACGCPRLLPGRRYLLLIRQTTPKKQTIHCTAFTHIFILLRYQVPIFFFKL